MCTEMMGKLARLQCPSLYIFHYLTVDIQEFNIKLSYNENEQQGQYVLQFKIVGIITMATRHSSFKVL